MPISCCFTLTDQNLVSDHGCTYPLPPLCVDPTNPVIDQNQDGELDTQEITQNVCARKCPNEYPFWGPDLYPLGDDELMVTPPYIGCVPLTGEVLEDEPACDPSHPSHLEPYSPADVTPTHEGTLVAGAPSSQSDVTINGVTVAVDYTGSVEFFLDNCISSRPYEQCDLGLRSLRLDMLGAPKFGDYRVDEAILTLAYPRTTTVDFVCDRTECIGTFELSRANDTAIDLNLNWEQTNLTTSSPGGGGLLLSNGAGGLGGVDSVSGRLVLDISKSTGTIMLEGSGADAFGGDLASANFQLHGTVGRPL